MKELVPPVLPLLLLALSHPCPAFAVPYRDGPSAAITGGKVFLTREEALALAFPDCKIERATVYLDEAHKKKIGELAKVDFDQGVVYTYRATRDGKPVGTAYFDTHRVRTLKETLMVVVGPEGSVQRIELLSFAEPPDYVPRASWYAQFAGRSLDDELDLKRGIRPIVGATLTARATTAAVRRVLAIHTVLAESEPRRDA